MDVVFMGTPEFAVPSLKVLAATHNVRAVYTQPDAVSRRGSALVPPPVKVVAEELGLLVVQPSTLQGPDGVQRLRLLAPDIICVAAYGKILPADVLALPRLGCINVHASLLPRYRGAAPIHRAVLGGDEVLGVSIMHMEEGLDTGPYALQRSIPAGDSTVAQLTDMLAEEGAQALLEVLAQLESGHVSWVPQDEALATYAAKITREDVALYPGLTTRDARRRIRASTCQAASRLMVGDVIVTVVSASIADVAVEPGKVLAGHESLIIGLSDGALRLDRIRPAGRSDMGGGDWVCGARLPAVCTWQAVS